MDKISDLLPGLLEKLLRQGRVEYDVVLREWPKWVGEDLAKCARPIWLTKGELLIEVDNHAAMDRLRYKKASLIQEINAKLGEELVSSIKFRLGG